MAQFVEFEVADGVSVLFETADNELVRRHSSTPATIDGGELQENLLGAAEAADAVSRTLRERLAPDQLSLELGLKVSGQANWFVAKAATEGNVKVTLTWKREPGGGPQA